MKNKRKIHKCDTTKFSSNKLFLLNNKNLNAKNMGVYLPLFFLAASFYVIIIHIDINQERYNVIENVWEHSKLRFQSFPLYKCQSFPCQ
jgi:hypothetical protein